jgi:hypothetical protein
MGLKKLEWNALFEKELKSFMLFALQKFILSEHMSARGRIVSPLKSTPAARGSKPIHKAHLTPLHSAASRHRPVADELPQDVTVVFSTHISQSSSEVTISMTKPFSEIPPKDCRAAFLEKCKECTKICDWSVATNDVKGKAAKTHLLKHIIAGFAMQGVARSLTSDLFASFFEMLSANLFRSFPAIKSHAVSGTKDSLVDAAWVHVSLCYECLNSSLHCPGLAEFPSGFSKHLVNNILAPDDRERDAAKQALNAIYTKSSGQRLLIRQRISTLLINGKCTAELLEFLGTVVANLQVPLKSESIDVFTRLILPLHCLTSYSQFHRQLTQVIHRYIAKSESLLAVTIGYLNRHWPICNRTKQVLHLKEYEEIMVTFEQKATPEDFVVFIRRISDAVNHESSQNAQAALEIVRNQQLYQHLKAIPASLFYRLTLEIHAAAKSHWDEEIREDAALSLEVMKGIDAVAFAKATESRRMAQARKASIFGVCKAGWMKVSAMAITGDANADPAWLAALERLRSGA